MEENTNDTQVGMDGGRSEIPEERKPNDGETIGASAGNDGRTDGSDTGGIDGSDGSNNRDPRLITDLEREYEQLTEQIRQRDRSKRRNSSGTAASAKNGKNSQAQNFSQLDLDVNEASPVEVKKRGRRKKKTEDSNQTALVILMVFDGLVTTFVSPQASLNQTERGFIEPPLARIIERIPEGTVEFVEKYTDPILLIFGLCLWGYRVAQLKPPKEKKQVETEQTEEQFSQNGTDASYDASPDDYILNIMGGL